MRSFTPSSIAETLDSMSSRIRDLEARLGFTPLPENIEDWLYSPEGIEAFKHACRCAAQGDHAPLERYAERTGGRAPRLHERRN